MYKHSQRRDIRTAVKGLWLARPIKFERRVPEGKTFADFFGDYNQQKWGVFDTNSCWVLGGMINSAEDQCELLANTNNYPEMKCQFTPEAMAFFKKYKYIDEQGDFSFSERFIEILGGRRMAGGWSELAWQLAQQYGLIPRSMLTYTEGRVQEIVAKNGFDMEKVADDYFNPAAVTEEMKALGQEFKKHVNIAYQKIGTAWETPERQILKKFLQMAPLNIGVPVPEYTPDWNNLFVKWDGKVKVDHEVELYDINEKGEYMIFDQYNPHLKTLASNYPIVYCTIGVLYPTPQANPNPVQQDKYNFIWSAIMNFFSNAWKEYKFAA